MAIAIPVPVLILLVGVIISWFLPKWIIGPLPKGGSDYSHIGNAAVAGVAAAIFLSGLVVTLIVLCFYFWWQT